MRRKILLPLVLASLFLLSACGGGGTETSDADSGDDAPSKSAGDAAAGSMSDMLGEAVELSEDDLAYYTAFLNEPDVYGFLLSSYDDVRDADLFQVFYDGAGVAGEIEDWMREAYDPEGYGGDLTFVPAEAMDAVLVHRTGYTLDEFLGYGNAFVYQLDEEQDFFNVHGDTNRLHVEAVSGERYPDGSVRVDSNEWYSDDPNVFSTVLLEREDDDPLIYSNQVTRGILLWMQEQQAIDDEIRTTTAETPPFDGYTWSGDGPAPEDPLPVTLDVVSDTENGGSDPRDWMAAHWDEWMRDPDFAAAQSDVDGQVQDADAFFLYRPEDGVYEGEGLTVWTREEETPYLSVDLSAFLFPPDTEEAFRGPETAQSVRWARLLNGELIVSNWDDMGTGRSAFLTALDPYDGTILWRTDPGMCESEDFVVLGVLDGTRASEGVLVCGGSTGEAVALYQIALDSGRMIDRTILESPADWLVHANSHLYVHCRDRDYEFAVSFG